MKVYKIEEIIKAAREYDYKLGEIFDQAGNKALKSHGVHQKPVTWLEKQVRPFLQRKNATPGIYQIYLWSDSNKKGSADIFPLTIGGAVPQSDGKTQIVLSQPSSDREHVLTYQGALEIKTENEKLKLENIQLKKELAELEALVKEYETDEAGLSEQPQPQHWAAELLAGAVPVIQQFFVDRQEQRKLEYAKLQAQLKALRVPAPQAQPDTPPTPEEQQQMVAQKVQEFFTLLQRENPEAYEQVAEITKGANEETFMQALQEGAPSVYEALTQYLNAA